MDSISQKLEKLGILPVVSLANPQRDALPLAEALIRGGLPAVEVTFRMAGPRRPSRPSAPSIRTCWWGPGRC